MREEIYVVLTPGEWRQCDGPWHEPGAGGIVHNPPGHRACDVLARIAPARSVVPVDGAVQRTGPAVDAACTAGVIRPPAPAPCVRSPKRIELVDALPNSAAGKFLKARLRAARIADT